MLTSIAEYCPEVPVYLRGPESIIGGFDADLKVFGASSNFGDAYNDIMDRAFADGFESVICANDDIVLTPTSYRHLMEDVAQLKVETGEPVGWVSARCDAARPVQNIRSNPFDQQLHYFKYPMRTPLCRWRCLVPSLDGLAVMRGTALSSRHSIGTPMMCIAKTCVQRVSTIICRGPMSTTLAARRLAWTATD